MELKNRILNLLWRAAMGIS